MGILMASWGLGPAVAVPLMVYLLVHLGWQNTFWATAGGLTVIMAILIYLYKNTPSDIGTDPYGTLTGESVREEVVIDKARARTFVKSMKKTAAYYNMSSIHFLGCVGHAIILVYLIPIAIQEGISLVSAAPILTVMAAVSVPSRLFVPVLAEKIGVRTIMAIFFFLQGVTVIMLFWTHEQWMFYLFALVFGIGYGGESGGFPILNRRYYGHAPQGSPYGFQMLGARLHDPLGVEGAPGSTDGLGLLDMETTLEAHKQLSNVSGTLCVGEGASMTGYEIHMGVSRGAALARPAVRFDDGRGDGAISADGQVLGSYAHGLFDAPAALAALLGWAGVTGAETVDVAARRQADLDRLADCLAAHLDLDRLARCFGAAHESAIRAYVA